MKTKMLFISAFLFFLLSQSSTAQPLSGIYTIGGISADYLNINAAVSALSTNGVSGPVVFNINSATYNEQVSIPQITGASSTNTVTFRSLTGDSTSVTVTYAASSAAQNYVISLNGADYIILEKISIQATGALYARAIEITGGANVNIIRNNVISGNIITSNSEDYAVIYNSSLSTDNNNLIMSNVINNGSYGIYYFGESTSALENGTEIIDNNINNQYFFGIFMRFQDSPIISGNILNNNLASSNYYGIECRFCQNDLRVVRNRITKTGNGGMRGIHIYSCTGTASHPGIIANNFISFQSMLTFGINSEGNSYQKFVFNSVSFTGNYSTSKLFVVMATTSNVEIRNNILANNGNGHALFCYVNSGFTLDYNDLYTNGTNLANINSTNYTDLASWQAASSQDPHSISLDPQFISATDLHTSYDTLKAGIPVPEVTDDIDGELRDAVTPWIGADENVIPPVVISSFPWLDDFESGQGAWMSGGTLSSWQFGTPAGTVINHASSGTNCWVTNLTGNYNHNENSYVESPYFDMSQLQSPIIELDIWWNCEITYDGAALQYSTDLGNTWNHVGTFGDPFNWYTYHTVTGLMFAGNQNGWSGRIATGNGSNGWRTAKHAIPNLAGNPMVKLRIVFGSDVSVADEGFAFDNVRIYDHIDIAVGTLMHPVSSCNMSNEHISLSIINQGETTLHAGDTIIAAYDKGISHGEEFLVLTSDLAPLDSIIYTFSSTEDFSTNTLYTVITYVSVPHDMVRTNDTLISIVENYAEPFVSLGGLNDTIYTGFPYLLNPGAGYASYLWQNGSGGQTCIANNPGWYSVTVSNSDGCLATDSVYLVSLTGIEDAAATTGINVYPNPTGGIVHLEASGIQTAEILDLNGRLVILIDGSEQSAGMISQDLVSATIDLSNLNDGVYFLKVNCRQTVHYSRIILHR